MTKDEKFKVYEVLLTEKSFERAIITLDLAGVHLQRELAEWLKLFYSAGDCSSQRPRPEIAIKIMNGERVEYMPRDKREDNKKRGIEVYHCDRC